MNEETNNNIENEEDILIPIYDKNWTKDNLIESGEMIEQEYCLMLLEMENVYAISYANYPHVNDPDTKVLLESYLISKGLIDEVVKHRDDPMYLYEKYI